MNRVQKISTLLNISRQRFWLYTAGPALLGSVVAAPTWLHILAPINILYFFYFLVPANVWLYGINDWFDGDTDAKNAKKKQQESLLLNEQKMTLLKGCLFFVVCTVVLWWITPARASVFWLWVFVILAWGYSAPPLRFKARPFLDAYSNVLYIAPFAVTSTLYGGAVSWAALLAGGLWAVGMHVLSAIPDIRPDSAANISTTATHLGAWKSLLFVGMHWLVSASVAVYHFGAVAAPVFIYALLIGSQLYVHRRHTNQQLEEIIGELYWRFPHLNALVGFYLFWVVALSRFSLAEIFRPLASFFS